MSERRPITPTRVIPAGETLPAPAAPPPPPPRPPAPPAVPDPEPDWWRNSPAAAPPPPPVEVHHHYYTAPAPIYLPVPVDPEPAEHWWQRIRIGYNAACAACGFAICGPWAWVLNNVRTSPDGGLAGAWVIALIPLTVLAFLDNARRAEAAGAHPDLWAPKLRAAVMRVLLYAAAIATVLALPVTTIVFLITGVRT